MSLTQQEMLEAEKRRQEIETEVNANPVVQELLAKYGAHVKEIKIKEPT